MVAITDKVRLPEPAHGGGVVGCAKVAVASCWIVLLDAEHNPDHAGQELEEVDQLAPSEMQRDLPAPSPTRFERVAAETVFTSVSPKDVVWLSGCQKVQVNAGVGDDQEVLPEYQVLHLGRPRGEFVGGEADQQASGVDHPAEDNQPLRRGALGDCLVDGEDFVSG